MPCPNVKEIGHPWYVAMIGMSRDCPCIGSCHTSPHIRCLRGTRREHVHHAELLARRADDLDAGEAVVLADVHRGGCSRRLPLKLCGSGPVAPCRAALHYTHMKIAWITPSSFAVLFVGVLAFPTKAEALGPADIEIGARAGAAPLGPLGPLGFGIGGRGGVSILGFYAGIDVIDYLGATSTCGGCSMPGPLPGQMPGGQLQQRRSALLYGFEAGYNFKVSLVTIRPQLGLGNARLSNAAGNPPPSPGDISNYFYLEPGVVGLVSLGMFFVGADVNALILPTGPNSALTVHGQIGVTF